jgi:hypothetical protein
MYTTMNSTRSILCFFSTIIGGLALYVALFHLLNLIGKDVWMTVTMLASFLVAGILSWRLFRKRPVPVDHSTEETLAQKGLLEVQEFTAKRAFTVEEFEDEGAHCFLELADGSVLYLNGQYLYDVMYVNPPTFPCSRFRIKRRKTSHQTFGIEPLSPYIAPESEFPPFSGEEEKFDAMPCDGDFLKKSYDELKHYFANRSTRRN